MCTRVDERLENNTGSLNNDCFLYPSTENITLKEHTRQTSFNDTWTWRKKKKKKIHDTFTWDENQITVRRHTIDHNQSCCAAAIVHWLKTPRVNMCSAMCKCNTRVREGQEEGVTCIFTLSECAKNEINAGRVHSTQTPRRLSCKNTVQ